MKLILICDVHLQGRMTKLLGMFRKKREATAGAQGRCAACPLAACALGARAAVLRMDCEGSEAFRLRNLGLYEGACVTILDRQDGLLLDVRGSRLALGASLASLITVLPLAS